MTEDFTDHEESSDGNFVSVAERMVERLVRERERLHVVQLRILMAAVAVLIVLSAVLGYFVVQNHEQVEQAQNLASALRQGSVTVCKDGNTFRAEQTAIWNKLFFLSYGLHPPQKGTEIYKVQQEFLSFIHKTDAPKDCAVLYGK